jgi:dimethylhistidine N-methyltransferase
MKPDLNEVTTHIYQWVEHHLSVPSVHFNDLPPCPYSKAALLRNKVDIRCGEGEFLLETLADIAHTWNDQFEMVMMVCDKDSITPEALMAGTKTLNETLKPHDLMTNFDHPDTTHPRYRVKTTNGRYVVAIVQRLSAFVEAAQPLFKKNYFKNVAYQYLSDYPSYQGNFSNKKGVAELNFINLLHEKIDDSFAADIKAGLMAIHKSIPVKYVYDVTGSELFTQITQQSEYYLTRIETELLRDFAKNIDRYCFSDTALVELGSGSAVKTEILIEALLAHYPSVLFAPIDIAGDFLQEQAGRLKQKYPNLQLFSVAADYHDGLEFLQHEIKSSKLVIWLGSDLGHFDYVEAATFLREQIVPLLGANDHFLLGLDLKKSPDIINAAYGTDNTKPIHHYSGELAKNALRRINAQLQADFNLAQFVYEAVYSVKKGCVELFLKSTVDQIVAIHALNLSVTFAKNERILIHTSYKYDEPVIAQLAALANLDWKGQWTDEKRWYSLNLFSVKT